MMPWIIGIGSAWFLFDVLAYIVWRRPVDTDDAEQWTVGQRRAAWALSLGGPVSLIVAGFVWLVVSGAHDDRPAKW